jgi:hypothetical protein
MDVDALDVLGVGGGSGVLIAGQVKEMVDSGLWELVNVPYDNMCFFHGFFLVAGDYVRQRLGPSATVVTMRDAMAAALQNDFDAHDLGYATRYYEYLRWSGDPGMRAWQRVQYLQMSWSTDMGDLFGMIAADVFDVPLTIVRELGDFQAQHYGLVEPVSIVDRRVLVHGRNHYYALVRASMSETG